MQAADSRNYYTQRAAEELAKAERCSDERAAQSHRDLARCYQEQADGNPADTPEDNAPNILPKDFQILP